MPLSEEDHARMRQEFYRVNGKTPEQESDDSVRMLAYVMLYALVVFILVAWGLIAYFW